jgi:hypothetical protein
MAGRQRSTFQKRQKEVKRLEKQKMKADKRAARREARALNRGPASPEAPPPPADLDLNQP